MTPSSRARSVDIIGLYLNPPQPAIVFSVSEKTATQALNCTLPVFPFSPEMAGCPGFEYIRIGTLSLYTATGKVIGKTAAHQTNEEFVAFLSGLIAAQSRGQEIHIVADNISAHKTKRLNDFLADHPTVSTQLTPTYSSWLNQVELWFKKIDRDVIARGILKSADDLSFKLMRYIRNHNVTAKPIKWKYGDPSRRIRVPRPAVTVH